MKQTIRKRWTGVIPNGKGITMFHSHYIFERIIFTKIVILLCILPWGNNLNWDSWLANCRTDYNVGCFRYTEWWQSFWSWSRGFLQAVGWDGTGKKEVGYDKVLHSRNEIGSLFTSAILVRLYTVAITVYTSNFSCDFRLSTWTIEYVLEMTI